MKTVKIADLKAHLSAYLREVRSGKELVVADRETPFAVLTPISARDNPLGIRKATHPHLLKQFKGIRPRKDFDPLEALWEERARG